MFKFLTRLFHKLYTFGDKVGKEKTMGIDDYGKGLEGEHPRDRDPKRFQLLGANVIELAGVPTVDFNMPSGIPAPPDEDQGSSLSCTWQAFAYYFWQWTGIQLSRRDGYSRTHLPGGGGYLADPFRMMLEGKGEGAFDRTQSQDPNPQTEQNMTVVVNLPGQQRKVFKLRYWNVPYNNIEACALAMRTWKGLVIGVNGNNTDWANGEHPNVPKPGTVKWAHALYCHENGFDRGQEALIAKSSWCNWVKRHFIIKDYFTSGNVFSPIAMEVREVPLMDDTLIVNIRGAYGLLRISDGRVLGGVLVANKEEALSAEKIFEKKLYNDDGTLKPADIVYFPAGATALGEFGGQDGEIA